MAEPDSGAELLPGRNPHFQPRLPRWAHVRVIGWAGLALDVIEDAGEVLILQIVHPIDNPKVPGEQYHELTQERPVYCVDSDDLGPPAHHLSHPDPDNPARCLKCDLMVLAGEGRYLDDDAHGNDLQAVWTPK